MGLQYTDFKNCAQLARICEDYRERRERLLSLAERVTTALPDTGVPIRGKADDRMAGIVAELLEQEEGYAEQIEAYLEHVRIVEEAIKSLSDTTQQRVLMLRYIDGLSWDDVAGKMHYDERWCRRLQERAFYQLCVIDPERPGENCL